MQTFIAKTISGLEEVLAAEIAALGAGNVQLLKRAVSFEGDLQMLYKANYCLRTAQRILMPVFSFELKNEDDLYDQVKAYEWEKHLSLQKTLAVDAVVSDSEFTHSHFVALRTKDAIVDRFRDQNNGRRPSVDIENPHIRINVHIRGNMVDISLDSSGASLHKRGYRVSNAEAPMSEVLAAGLIQLTGWQRDCNFVDPMCGSGTLLIEAAIYANNFPAGMYRKEFGFMHWPDFDERLWNEVTTEALSQQTEFEYQIVGSDISPQNLAACRANLKSARLHKDVKVFVSPIAALQPPNGKPGIMLINPPYGERIRLNDIIGLYRSIGDVLKQQFSGYQAWVISSDLKALSFIGLKPSAKLPVFNGQLECRFVHYDLYKGSKRGRYQPQDEESAKENRFAHSNDNYRKNDKHAGAERRIEEKHRSSRSSDHDDSKPFEKKPGKEHDPEKFNHRQKDREPGRPKFRTTESETEKPKRQPAEGEPFWKKIAKTQDESKPAPPSEPEFVPRIKAAEGKVPSQGSKFSQYRDYQVKRRPRKNKSSGSEPQKPASFDDLED